MDISTTGFHDQRSIHDHGSEAAEEKLAAAEERIRTLERAQVAAESANRAKSELLARLSHELRTPLTGVVGYADLLLVQRLDGKLRKLVHGIVAAGDALLAVVDEIKDLSSFENGTTALAPEEVDPRQLVAGVVELFTPRTRAKNLGLELEVEHEVPARVVQDAERLRQVLVHLVSNAVKVTVAGSVSIRVTLGHFGGDPRLRFMVRDTGAGIPAEVIATLFDPFTLGDASSAGHDLSTGLGLALSQRQVEEMGGILEVESSLGLGSTFTFEVPFTTTGARSADLHHEVSEPGAPATILLVEDNELNRIYVTQQLEILGHQAVVAVNGHEALALLEVERFDLVLMDCQMPGLDGYETARCLRVQEKDGARTPIVAVTADAMNGDRARCLAAGMDDYIPKPFHCRDLKAVLDKWLSVPQPDGFASAADGESVKEAS